MSAHTLEKYIKTKSKNIHDPQKLCIHPLVKNVLSSKDTFLNYAKKKKKNAQKLRCAIEYSTGIKIFKYVFK